MKIILKYAGLILPIVFAACVPISNAYKGSDIVANRPRLDWNTRILIWRLLHAATASDQQNKLASEVAAQGVVVIPEMILLSGKRRLIPFLPPGPTWEAAFFIKMDHYPYPQIASEVVSQIRDPKAIPILHKMVQQQIMAREAALGLQALKAPMDEAELSLIFPLCPDPLWNDTLSRIVALPKDQSVRLLLRYLGSVTAFPQFEPWGIDSIRISMFLGCGGGADATNLDKRMASRATRIVPIPDDDFRRYRDVASALKKTASIEAAQCVGRQIPTLNLLAQRAKLEASQEGSDYAGNYPVQLLRHPDDVAVFQLGEIISDYQEIVRNGSQ